ncbi:M14 family zinc carboxypeptidase [Halomonas maura]|uniref:M14 family zinc carboxypeptidase n=1 Tax=Halomonas maura TaxID=117606 RepID=UPI0025B2D7C0|nr:M14 family zinc carboxypeptidase [Halomonas maura]MDN3556519.1 M14 family zinc carboxypeptidase [Halomonas maura]
MKRQYASYQETIDILTQAQQQYPNLIRVQSIGETWEGRPIMLATISQDVTFADLKPALLYTGSIHAREWIGNELALRFIQYLLKNHEFNPRVLSALARNTLYIVPCLNPDGFEFSRNHFSFWRKNRRDNGDGTYGVDLNRNFGIRFKKGTNTGSNTYSGPHAFSEPETKAIKDFVDKRGNITIALDYHSQGNVFFPAHKFNHENEIDGTDLNRLCANMNHEIEKVTSRRYGIHRGKPPFNLINGSGREYYYSRGILATVVEVGTRNIPDYMQVMSQSIDENIPAILRALEEAINYSPVAPKRVENFTMKDVEPFSVTLQWEYDASQDVVFEIYRSEQPKAHCSQDNLVAVTRSLLFTDVQLRSGHTYYYNIRALNRLSKVYSAFSPELSLKTLLSPDEFSRRLFPSPSQVGYVGQLTKDRNREHFGHNSLFIGINQTRGICHGVLAFSLESLPENAVIKSAKLQLYPMNRVSCKIEKYGEWVVSMLEPTQTPDIMDFESIHNVRPLHTLGHAIESDKLTQGIWSEWKFNQHERELLKEQVGNKQVVFRVSGPDTLPIGNDSQIMQFDIGYGKFGGGIHYRPCLDVIYTKQPDTIELEPIALNTIFEDEVVEGQLKSGFDQSGQVVYGQMEFSSSLLPAPEETVITDAYLVLQNKNSLNTTQDTRFTIELAELRDLDLSSVKGRQKIEYIGYEVSNEMLKKDKLHHFAFDRLCKSELERFHAEDKSFYFIVRATRSSYEKSALIDWHDQGDEKRARLVLNYITRRRQPLATPGNFTSVIEDGMVKLTWENPEHKDFVGCYVVRNRFHPPRSPFDGVKLYGGKDEYTYDNFGNPNIPKYYSVFSYDNVPNYSTPACLYFSSEEVVPIHEEEMDEVIGLQEDEQLDA